MLRGRVDDGGREAGAQVEEAGQLGVLLGVESEDVEATGEFRHKFFPNQAR